MPLRKKIALVLIILLIIGGVIYFLYKKGIIKLPLTQAQKDSIARKEARFQEVIETIWPADPKKEVRFGGTNPKEGRFTTPENPGNTTVTVIDGPQGSYKPYVSDNGNYSVILN